MPTAPLPDEPAWVRDAVFYHVYPLGACGAPDANDQKAPPVTRLDTLLPWIEAWSAMGVDALYIGPLFESSTHGYDTADYLRVDRRLGDDAALERLVEALHARGIRVVLDAVFHHVGRDFWAFRDVQQHGEASAYRDWFAGLRFDAQNRFGDPFVYDGWQGVDELVKLDLGHEPVRRHLFEAVEHWVRRFDIDGLRLDAADAISKDFFDGLSAFCDSLPKPLWLMGEVIHGDYREWVRPGRLHSTTDYALWKGLWSSHNDHNYFELAHTLKRQVAAEGMYEGMALYTFADNHDVDRVASTLGDPRHLPLVYLLLFTLPGVPSIYYGSEWGERGRKEDGGDAALRPALPPSPGPPEPPQPGLRDAIARLIALRRGHEPLRRGGYRELLVRNEQLAFVREAGSERRIVAVNCAAGPATVDVPLAGMPESEWVDLLDPSSRSSARDGRLTLELAPCAGRVLAPAGSLE